MVRGVLTGPHTFASIFAKRDTSDEPSAGGEQDTISATWYVGISASFAETRSKKKPERPIGHSSGKALRLGSDNLRSDLSGKAARKNPPRPRNIHMASLRLKDKTVLKHRFSSTFFAPPRPPDLVLGPDHSGAKSGRLAVPLGIVRIIKQNE